MSTVGSQLVQRVELHYPRHGTSWARVETVKDPVPLGPALLTIGDLVLAGTIIRSGIDSPSSWVGIWVTGAGWDTPLPTRPPYQNDSGVRLKSVLTDLATDCGVSVALPVDTSMGTHWSRSALAGNRRSRTGRDEIVTLQRLGHFPTWWVDPQGVTRFAVRTGSAIKAASRVTRRNTVRGQRALGVDSPAAFTPGGTFEGVIVERVIIREDGGKLVLETWES